MEGTEGNSCIIPEHCVTEMLQDLGGSCWTDKCISAICQRNA